MARAAASLRSEVVNAANHALDAGHAVPVPHTNLLAAPDVAVIGAYANGLDVTAVAAGIAYRTDGRTCWLI